MADAPIQTTIIGADTRINGEMTFNTSAKVLGVFEGKIAAKGELHIAENATCKATVAAAKVLVEGTVEGNVTAAERIELSAKAKVNGDLAAARLTVLEGASLIGHCNIGPNAAKSQDADATSFIESKPVAVQSRVQAAMQGWGDRVEARHEAVRR